MLEKTKISRHFLNLPFYNMQNNCDLVSVQSAWEWLKSKYCFHVMLKKEHLLMPSWPWISMLAMNNRISRKRCLPNVCLEPTACVNCSDKWERGQLVICCVQHEILFSALRDFWHREALVMLWSWLLFYLPFTGR